MTAGWLAACLALVAVPSFARRGATPQPDRVRHWSTGEVTRVAVEIPDAESRVLSDRLVNPDRVFFDVPIGDGPLTLRKVRTIPVGDGRVRQIRLARTQPSVLRVVLDVEPGVEHTVNRLANPPRLMIELRSPRTAEPAPPPRTISRSTELPAVPPTRPAAREAAATVPRVEAPKELPLPGTVPDAPSRSSEARMSSRNSRGDRSLTRALGLKLGRVVLDAGHGGHDQGSSGPTGLLEKDLVLDVARRLGALIESRLGSEVVYTRSDDTFLPLERRTELANDAKADLFLSIHANSSPAQQAGGVETYYLNMTGTPEAMDVAARENAGAQRSIHDLRDLVQRIALTEKADESREFAQCIQTALQAHHNRSVGRMRDRGVKRAPFVVLIGASMPSVLAEIGFVSNPREESLLRRGDHRQRIAEALYKGLSQYANSLSHFSIARASAGDGE